MLELALAFISGLAAGLAYGAYTWRREVMGWRELANKHDSSQGMDSQG